MKPCMYCLHSMYKLNIASYSTRQESLASHCNSEEKASCKTLHIWICTHMHLTHWPPHTPIHKSAIEQTTTTDALCEIRYKGLLLRCQCTPIDESTSYGLKYILISASTVMDFPSRHWAGCLSRVLGFHWNVIISFCRYLEIFQTVPPKISVKT